MVRTQFLFSRLSCLMLLNDPSPSSQPYYQLVFSIYKLLLRSVVITESSSALVVDKRCTTTVHAWPAHALLLRD